MLKAATETWLIWLDPDTLALTIESKLILAGRTYSRSLNYSQKIRPSLRKDTETLTFAGLS
jgi:hypothetical protein